MLQGTRLAAALALALVSPFTLPPDARAQTDGDESGDVVTHGHLVACGGGEVPRDALVELIAHTGKNEPFVVILPQGHAESPERGAADERLWRSLGIPRVEVLDPLTDSRAEDLLAAADILWLSGDDQRALMRELNANTLTREVIAQLYRGCQVGATGGAARLVGPIMIGEAPEPRPLLRHAMHRFRGLGLIPEALVEPHFTEEDRFAEMATMILDSARFMGLGIDEGTAVVMDPLRELRVVGEGTVTVLDARRATQERGENGTPQRARDVRLHVLAAGDSFPLLE